MVVTLNRIHKIEYGLHARREDGVCAMEAVAWMAGERHSDEPACTSPVIAAFVRQLNDSMRSDTERELLRPLLPNLIGTASPKRDGLVAMKCVDWLIKKQLPAWLRLTPDLERYAAAAQKSAWNKHEGLCVLLDIQEAAEDYIKSSRGIVSQGVVSMLATIASNAVSASGAGSVTQAVQYVSDGAKWYYWEQRVTNQADDLGSFICQRAAYIAALNAVKQTAACNTAMQAAAFNALEPTVLILQRSAIDLLSQITYTR